MVFEGEESTIAKFTISSLDEIAKITKADIFLVDPEEKNEDGTPKTNAKELLKLTVYGDMLTKENAKIRILILIDQIVSSALARLCHSKTDPPCPASSTG